MHDQFLSRRLKPSEVAAIWGCSTSQVLTLIRTGKLKAINIGTCKRCRYVISPEELERFEKGQDLTKPVLRRPRRPKVKQYL